MGLKIDIEKLRSLCCENGIKMTMHALKRIRERKILSSQITEAVLSGKIIEQYEDDKYYPSCLIFNNDYNRPLHIVVSTDNKKVYIITAYFPTLDEWENDFKTRKEKK